MYGENIGTLAVEYTYSTIGLGWFRAWEMRGQQHELSGTKWKQQIIELPEYAKGVRFYFEAAGGYKGDIAIDEVEFLEANTTELSTSFQSGLGWSNTGEYNWLRTTGSTPSSNTGPASAATGISTDYYAFLETSSGHAFNMGNTAVLESPYFTTMYEVCYSYHMYGSDMGSLTLEGLDENNEWQRIQKYVGMKHSLSGASWYHECQPLDPGIQKLRFVGEANGGYMGDMAIDDISLVGPENVFNLNNTSITYEEGSDAIIPLDFEDSNLDIDSVSFRYVETANDSDFDDYWVSAPISLNDDGLYYVNVGQLPDGYIDLEFRLVTVDGTVHIVSFNGFRVIVNTSNSLVIPDVQYNNTFTKSHNDASGATQGNFSVSPSGVANYSIPLILPKGRFMATPEVALNYSSAGSNRLLGKGWSLSAVSSITRCGRSYTIDEEITAINWDITDRFCLNGSQLILKTGTYGVAGSTYTTEIEQHSTITLYNNPHSGTSSFFILKDKSGALYLLGSDTNAKEINSNNNLVYQWSVNQRSDLAGNRIYYNYENSGNEFYLSSITYNDGAFEILFNTEERDDPYSMYIAGHRKDINVRYKNIEINGITRTLLRSYELDYEDFSSSALHKLTKLKSITECSADACYQPTTFEWTDVELGPPAEADGVTISANYVTGAGVADMNGDGISDLVLQKSANGNTTTCTLSTYLGSPSGLQTTPAESRSGKCEDHDVSNVTQYRSLMLNDINGDNRADHNGFITSYNTSTDDWETYKNAATDDFIQTNTYDLFSIEDRVLTGDSENEDKFAIIDVNGDGLADYVEWADADYIKDSISFSEAEIWTQASQIRVYLAQMDSSGHVSLDKDNEFLFDTGIDDPELDANYMAFGDFDGDGLPEILVNEYFISLYHLTQPDTAYTVFKFPDFSSSNQTLTSLITFEAPGSMVQVADINGDGLSDVIANSFLRAEDGDPDGDNKVFYFINDGISQQYTLTQLTGFTTAESSHEKISLGDYNQDGFLDLNFEILTWLWNPETETFEDSNIEYDFFNTPIQADFNGDGRLDVLTLGVLSTVYNSGADNANYYTDPVVYINMNSSELTNRIKTITNGLGHTTQIVYENIAVTDHYLPFDLDVSHSSIDDTLCINLNSGFCKTVYDGSVDNEASFYSRLASGPLLPESTSDSLNEDYPIKPLTGSMSVVTSVQMSNPYASNTNSSIDAHAMKLTEYFYGRGFSQSRRGFLGFETITKVDHSIGIAEQSVYRQDYPFQGLVAVKQLKSLSGVVLSTSYTDWRMNRAGTSSTGDPIYPYQIYPDSSVTATYDFDSGAFIKLEEVQSQLTDDGHQELKLVTVSDQDVDFIKSSKTEFSYDSSCGVCIERGLPQTTKDTNTTPDEFGSLVSKYTETLYEYYENSSETGSLGQLKSEEFEPNRPAYTYKKEFEYNIDDEESGPLTKETLSAAGLTSRVNRYIHGSARFVSHKYNAKDQLYEYVVSANAYGQPTLIRGLNGKETTIAYDSFGVKYFEATNDGNWVSTERQRCDELGVNCPIGAVVRVKTSGASGAQSFQYYDVQGRVVRVSNVSFDGTLVHSDNYHNAEGLLKFASTPYFEGESPLWTTYYYDEVGRKTATTNPDNSQTSMSYGGFTIVYTNELNQSKTEIRNAVGELVWVEDHDGGRVQNAYGPLGNLVSATSLGSLSDPHNIKVTIGYDDIGRKTSMSDPDKGDWEYRYNKYSELTFQKSANLETTENEYDVLGRQTKRIDRQTENGSIIHTTVWKFDGDSLTGSPSRSGDALGLLTGVVHNSSSALTCGSSSEVCGSFSYDSIGRIESATRKLGSNGTDGTYTYRTVYDEIGRTLKELDVLSTTSSHSGVYYHFNQYGYPLGVSNINGNELEGVYRLDEMTARGQVKRSTRGNMAESTYAYNQETGLIEQQLAEHDSSSYPIQQIDYTWDDIGNLHTRSNYSGRNSSGYTYGALQETFCYDDLNRIKRVEAGLNGSCNGADQYQYDSIGNIKYKHDVGTYTYSKVNAGPHAVTNTSIGNVFYAYDDNGNLTSDGKGRTLQYTVFDKPEVITKGSHTTRIYYGPERERWKRVESDTATGETTTTLYLGSVEKVHTTTSNSTTTEWQRYLGDFALFSEKSHTQNGSTVNTNEQQYIYSDYQGSTDVITNEDGDIITLMGFDVFGNRRNGYHGSYLTLDELKEVIDQQLATFVPTYSITTKGYTGHEMLDEVGLIHMNGRVYNPQLGRFVSADPLISQPDNTQSYNRYSYVQNRPMFYSDPSGFSESNDNGDDGDDELVEFDVIVTGTFTKNHTTGEVTFEGTITPVDSANGDTMFVTASGSLTDDVISGVMVSFSNSDSDKGQSLKVDFDGDPEPKMGENKKSSLPISFRDGKLRTDNGKDLKWACSGSSEQCSSVIKYFNEFTKTNSDIIDITHSLATNKDGQAQLKFIKGYVPTSSSGLGLGNWSPSTKTMTIGSKFMSEAFERVAKHELIHAYGLTHQFNSTQNFASYYKMGVSRIKEANDVSYELSPEQRKFLKEINTPKKSWWSRD